MENKKCEHCQRQNDEALEELLRTYQDLNSNVVDELYEEPTALEFMRYVARNRPFVIRDGCKDWAATQRWSADYLTKAMGDKFVNVAVTPRGNADAVVEQADGQLFFVQPWEQDEPFSDVLQYIRDQDPHVPRGPIKYAQTQNDNLRGEYESVFADVPKEIEFARIALQKEPDAINMWLGNNHSVTSLHKDDYENIYAQVRGRKSFVILPPIMAPCVNEQVLPAAKYEWTSPMSKKDVDRTVRDLKAKLCEPIQNLPWPTWDPDRPDLRATSLSRYSNAMKVELNQGDMLYLPAMWYHKVSQEVGAEGFSCAINYWYDMDFEGPFWATSSFIRHTAGLKHSAVEIQP